MTRDSESKRIITIDDPTTERSSVSRTKLRALGGCRIIAELGRGGMANVYLVVNQGRGGVNKLLVLKALRHELSTDAESLSMFLDEARVAAQLNHPNVVQTYEVGVHEGRNVLVMEYLEGQPFSRLLAEADRAGRRLPFRYGLRIVIAALEGLHYLHELRGIAGNPLDLVHRDVSPQNVFVTYDGQVKILDFGIAKATSSSCQTAVGVVKGKIAYMPPEQMTAATVDRRTDIYAVGCILWALGTGRKLWQGVPDVQVMARLLSGDLPSLSKERPGIDPRFARIVDKAMALRPADRYENALELQSELERYCDELGPPVKPKELGAFVSDLFAETRARVRGLIESQLSGLVNDPTSSAIQLVDQFPRSSSQLILSSMTPVSASQQVAASKAPVAVSVRSGVERRRAPWLLLAGLAAGVSATVMLGVMRTEPARVQSSTAAVSTEPKQPPVAASAAPTIAAPQPAVPTSATIRFVVEPASARLYLDGVSLPPELEAQTLPADGSKHTLRAEARGYVTRQVEFTANQDTSIELSLARADIAAPPRRAAPRVEQAPKPAASPPKKSKAVAACSDPFFIAEGGIKRVRPECR